jgi:hypothetical protein
MSKKVQMSIMVTPEIYDYIENMSVELGMSKSAYVNMVMVNHKRGSSLLDALPEIARQVNEQNNNKKE